MKIRGLFTVETDLKSVGSSTLLIATQLTHNINLKLNDMITGICMVLFAAISGEKVQVNMDAKEFAHFVYEFKKKKSSCFKEDFTYEKDGQIFHYKWFGLMKRFHKGYTLEFSV